MPLPTPHKGEARDKFISRCMTSEVVKSDYPDHEQAIAVCESQYLRHNSEVRQNAFLAAEVQTAEIRTGKLYGRDMLVVPVVALVEGVLFPSNAPGPELALAAEFGHFPEGWNGRPVVLNHPQEDGEAVSANSPRVLQNNAFGMLFNTVLDGSKLKTEAWIDVERANEMGGKIADAVLRLKNNEIMEVSTGLFMDLEEKTGTYNGEEYTGIWRNIVPDHLAILPPGTIGACSVADGCGAPRANSRKDTPMPKALRAGTTDIEVNIDPESAGTLSKLGSSLASAGASILAAARSLTAAGAAKGIETDPSKPINPIFTLDEKDPVKTLVESYPECGCEPKPGALSALAARFPKLLGFRSSAGRGGLSDVDARSAIQAAMSSKDMFGYIVAVYDNFFVYEDYMSGEVFQMGFSISPQGAVTLKDDSVQVRPVTEFVPVKTNQREETATMATKAKVDALITNSKGRFTENDRVWLAVLSDDQISEIEKSNPKAIEAIDASIADAAKKAADAAVASVTANSTKPKTLDEYVAAAPAEIQNVLTEGVRMQQARKDFLVNALKSNSRNKFSEETLKSFNLEHLENLASLAAVPTYEGAAVVRQSSVKEESNFAPPPPSLVETKAA